MFQRLNATHGFHATVTARPGKGEELVELLLHGAPTRNESCVLYLVGRSASDPDVVHITEGWSSKEAHTENFATARSQELVTKISLLTLEGSQYTDEIPVGGVFLGRQP